MMRHSNILLLGAICFAGVLQAAPTQESGRFERYLDRRQVMQALTSTLQTLTERMQRPEFQSYHHSTADFNRLTTEVERSRSNAGVLVEAPVEYSQQFLATVVYDEQAFQMYADSSQRRPVAPAVVNRVINAAADLAAKAHLVGTSRTDRVTTTVNTLDSNKQPVQNCDVWYAPFLNDDDQHKQKFDKRSTPTIDLIAGGKWNVWAERSGKVGVKVPYMCGDDGRTSREIDIPAP